MPAGVNGRPLVDEPVVEVTLDHLAEQWQNGVFDAALWGDLYFGGGRQDFQILQNKGSRIRRLIAGPTAGDQTILYGKNDWQRRSGDAGGEVSGYDETGAAAHLVLEFEAVVGSSSVFDNDVFFAGLAAAPTDGRTSDNIAGWILVGDELNVVTDFVGVETVTPITPVPNLNITHHYRMLCIDGAIYFFIDHLAVAGHRTNLDNAVVIPVWNAANAPAESALFSVTNISIGYKRYTERFLVV